MGVNRIVRIDCARLVTSSIDFKRSLSCSSSDVVSSPRLALSTSSSSV